MSVSEESHLVKGKKDIVENEAQTTNMWNVVLWYFFEISYHFYNCIVNVSVGPSLQLLSIYAGYGNSLGVLMTTVCNATANTIAMITSPFLGGLSDYYSFRKGAVISCAVTYYVCFLLAGIFYFHFWFVVICFMVSRTAYELVRLFYDCQIPYIMDNKNRTLAQSIGGAISFSGAIHAIIVSFCSSLIWGSYSNVNTLQEGELPSLGSLRELVLFNFFLGSFVFVPYLFSSEKSTPPAKRPILQTLKIITKDLGMAFKNYFLSRDCVFLFISWCCTLSAVSVVNGLLVVLLTTMCGLKKSVTDVVFLSLNLVALACGVPWAFFLNRFGPKRAMQVMLICLFFGMLFMVLTGMHVGGDVILSRWIIIPCCLTLGPALGVIYTASRQLVMELAPVQQLAQFSAVTKIAARCGGMVVPICFSMIVNYLCNNTFKENKYKYNYAYRIAQIPVFILLFIAFIFISLVRNRHKLYVQGKRAPYYENEDIEMDVDNAKEIFDDDNNDDQTIKQTSTIVPTNPDNTISNEDDVDSLDDSNNVPNDNVQENAGVLDE